MSWLQQKDELVKFAKTYNRAVILTGKQNWFWLTASYFLSPFMKRETFLTKFASTFGPIVGLPENWSYDDAKSVVVHEVGGHVKQFSWFGFCIPYVGPWIGILGMILFYGLLFPILFNWFRYRFELHADKQKWIYMLTEEKEPGAFVMSRAKSFAKTVSSWDYGKPIPQKWAIWGFTRAAKKTIEKYK